MTPFMPSKKHQEFVKTAETVHKSTHFSLWSYGMPACTRTFVVVDARDVADLSWLQVIQDPWASKAQCSQTEEIWQAPDEI